VGHVVDASEHAAVRGLGDPHLVGVDGTEGVAGEILGTQLAFDQRHYQRAGRRQIVRPDVRFEDREQCAGVGEQAGLARAEPEQVRLPVLRVGGRRRRQS